MVTATSNGPELGIILDLNQRYGAARTASKRSERDKLLVMAGGWLHLVSLGGLAQTGPSHRELHFEPSEAISILLAHQNIKNKVGALNHCAQLVLGLVIESITDTVERKAARNLVDRCARLYAALAYYDMMRDLPETEDALADWIEAEGGVDGVLAKHKADVADELGEVEPADDDAEALPQEVEAALSLNAVELNAEEPVDERAVLALIRTDEEGRMRLVPLPAVPNTMLGKLLPWLPAPDANLPDDIRVWGMASTCCSMIGRSASEELARPLEEDAETGATLDSGPIIRITGDRELVVAPSRQHAGIVCRLKATSTLALPGDTVGRHINLRGTGALTEHMAGGVSRGMYNGLAYDKLRHQLDFSSRDTRFKPFSVKTLPIEKFGSSLISCQWTLDVARFNTAAQVEVELEESGLPSLLRKFARKAGSSRHAVVVKLAAGEFSLALGKDAEPVQIPSSGDRKKHASAEIAGADLGKVVRALADLRPERVSVSIDKEGLVLFAASTRVATVLLFVPSLIGGVRNPKLFTRIERPRPEPFAAEPEAEREPEQQAA